MSLFSDLLPRENIILDLDVKSKKRLFEVVAELFSKNCSIDKDSVFQCLVTREKLGSTGLGSGVAIPHGRLPGLSQTIASFIRLKNPIDFDSQDEKPVSLVFVMLVSDEGCNEHLKILSFIAQKFSDKNIRTQLKTTDSIEEISALILED